jgi:hypothetical protein
MQLIRSERNLVPIHKHFFRIHLCLVKNQSVKRRNAERSRVRLRHRDEAVRNQNVVRR